MSPGHPAPESLHRLVAGRLGQVQGRRVTRHLSSCSECRHTVAKSREGRELLAELFPVPVPPTTADPSAYDAVLSRTFSVLLSRESNLTWERQQAPQLYAELAKHPLPRQEVLVRNVERFHTWGLAEHLLHRSSEACFEDPTLAEELAQAALLVTGHLEADFYGPSLINDLKARCWGKLANARRLHDDLTGAEAAFDRARRELEGGTADPLEWAHLLRMQASLRRDQGRFGEAEQMLRRAIATYRRVGDSHQAGKALLKLSSVHLHVGDPEKAIAVLGEAMGLISAEREPLMALGVRHNLIDALADAGRFMEARALLIKSRPLYRRCSKPALDRSLLWVKAKISTGLGQYEEAEAAYGTLRERFLELSQPYNVAAVSLELAAVYARQGRTAEVKRFAQETLTLFRALDVRRDALAALTMLAEAAQAERATVEWLQQTARRVKALPAPP